MLEKSRMNLLYSTFVVKKQIPEDQIDGLTLEELAYLFRSCELAKKNEKLKDIHFAIRQQIIYWAVVGKLRNADELYLAYTKAPSYPYVDLTGACYLFSTLENGERLVTDFRKKQKMELLLMKAEGKTASALFDNLLFYLGINGIILDNGTYPMALNRSDVAEDPEPPKTGEDPSYENRDLRLRLLQFVQYHQMMVGKHAYYTREGVTEEEKVQFGTLEPQMKQTLKVLEARMLEKLVDSRFLVPWVVTKDGVRLPADRALAEPGVKRTIALLPDKKSGTWLPAFTSMTEFVKVYKPSEWNALIVPFDTLPSVSGENGPKRFVLDPRGCSFMMTEQVIENIRQFAQKKNELEQKKKNEDTDVAYGELTDEPDGLTGALRRSAKALRMVRKLWLVQRVRGEEIGYLLVAEGSGVESALTELKKAAAGYLDGRTMDARQADAEALEIVKDIRPIYKRGLFG